MSIRAAVDAIAARNNPEPPSKLGVRYDANRFLPEAGNTVVCHLDRSDPAHKAVLAARSAIQSLPGANHLLFTAEDSLHMTVFDGIIDTGRTADAWPAGMDLTAAEGEIDSLQDVVPGKRLRQFASFDDGIHDRFILSEMWLGKVAISLRRDEPSCVKW